MEYEVRFYYPSSEVNNLLDKLSELKELEKKPRTYEKTVQYNHSDSKYDFYSKEIDGRFRLRLSKNIEESKCKLSWKRRLPNTTENLVNKEEEKEVRISYEDVDNFIFIIENVMHFKVVDSYERYRIIFTILSFISKSNIKIILNISFVCFSKYTTQIFSSSLNFYQITVCYI